MVNSLPFTISRKEFPRVYELKDLIKDHNVPTAYFQDFENSIKNDPAGNIKKGVFFRYELAFQSLDIKAWKFLKNKIKKKNYLTKGHPKGRGWEQLIATFNEAHGYVFLNDMGCSGIQFIPEKNNEGGETPDLRGEFRGNLVLCEVKTLNISDFEVNRRREGLAGDIQGWLDPKFFDTKLKGAIEKAKAQMESFETVANVRRIVYLIPNFDDLLGEYKVNYYEQIDQYLGDNPFSGIEIVFHNLRTAFHQRIIMKNATVVNEPL